MKKLLLFLPLVMIAFIAEAQIDARTLVKGKINVDVNSSAEDINVYNVETTKGTITNEYGEFLISVKKGDKLFFSGIQYQDFNVIIDENVVNSGKLNITINEAVNELDEVTVRPYDLSGNVEVDVAKIKTVDANFPQLSSAEMVTTTDYEFRPDSHSKVENDAIDKSYLTNGLNFANIFREIFKSNKNEEKEIVRDEIDVQIRKVYNDDFFRKNLDIDRENINEFIYYAEENGLQENMLQQGNELALIEFLIDKSKTYKLQQN
ncbi:carboxypeptidase-like regulatory domain-containing protein [Mesonia sp.]|uniref:carboxypeptidase-like regulatory domain-containing protein n=1 Tax=Mesonia sp. TaxID=1960830 RepID=UPI001752241A|nr:carboxypeptidase-like regulatory domain-containing protein [Mesonia sp.]HIB36463.1 hypothetical protein [Mesonia sp.]HIO27489.1 hypothetical protein [Flavobacteriaceae bacterium]